MIKEILKELGKVLLSYGAIIFIVMCPVFISLGFYYLSVYLVNIGFFPDYPQDLYSFFSGSVISSAIMFFFLIFLIQSKKIKMEGVKENAENTE